MTRLIHKTIGACFSERARLTPDGCGMSCRDYQFTWKDMDEISDFLAVEYMDMGIEKGNHAAIWSVNSPNWVLCFIALVKIGAVPIPVNTCYKEQELVQLLKKMDVQYLFYGNGVRDLSYQEILKDLDLTQLPAFKRMTSLEPKCTWISRTQYPDKMSMQKREKLKYAKEQIMPMDLGCIMPTSGTTNTPKGVMLSHYSLVNNALETCRQMHWNEQDRFCIAVPLFHCFGVTTGILAALHAGAELQLLKYYKTLDVLEQIEHSKSTVLSGVPTMFLAIIRNEKRNRYDLSSLKSGIIAGSPISLQEYTDICQKLKMEKLQVSYGQTESSPCISISDYNDTFEQKGNTAGKVIPEIEVKIQEDGEILTRGYHVMQGYYKMEKETKETIDAEGWLHTGDLGSLSSDGYLLVSGRIKDMIIRGGENISPLEIESCIRRLEGVRDVKVLGIHAEVLQEEIVACIIWREGMELPKEHVQAHVKKYLANYKVPRYIFSFQEFPLSGSGKIMTGELKKQIEEQIRNGE